MCSRSIRACCVGFLGQAGDAMSAAAHGLLLLIFLTRALVAPGYMPEVNARNGQVTVAMCSGTAKHKTMAVTLPNGSHKKQSERQDCSFAKTSAPFIAHPPAFPQPSAFHFLPDAPQALTSLPVAAAWRPSAPPTGPPAFA